MFFQPFSMFFSNVFVLVFLFFQIFSTFMFLFFSRFELFFVRLFPMSPNGVLFFLCFSFSFF